MRSAIPVTLFCGWLIPLLITAALYYGAMEYQQGDSRDGWDWFGLFAIAPYFFVVAGVLNLWILALRSRRKRVVFSFGLILPLVMLVLLVVTCGRGFASTPQGRLDEALSNLAKASSEEERFYALDDAAKASFEGGKIEDARKYAKELLKLAQKFQKDWNYGNAIQDGNLVLGRISLREGRTEEAKQYLLESGKSPGSPQMDSFGPNMSLARDLLEKGERETVLQYFELCRKFWDRSVSLGKLDQWTKEVKAGQIPDFGGNLVY